MIPEPYGGRLVDGQLVDTRREKLLQEVGEMPLLTPPVDQIYDAEKIATGAYSPLEGFQSEAELESVLNRMELSGHDSLPWSMPILLTPSGKENAKVLEAASPSDEVALAGFDGKPFAILRIEEKYRWDKKEFAQKVYGTTDTTHPNVADLVEFGETAVSGGIKLLNRLALPAARYELTPKETRLRFHEMGWKGVVGYQARNPPHTAHEYLQRVTMEREDVDGILIHPVVGKLKKGDYKPDVIMRAYEAFVTNYYPKDRAILASFSIAMRYAGPKAALFYAIVRRNFGCSHYIVGRDQAGVGTFYEPYACHRVFDNRDIGILPLRYTETFYCTRCGWMASSKVCPHPKEDRLNTSQTKIRALLNEKKPLPTEILRPEVSKVLMEGDVINE